MAYRVYADHNATTPLGEGALSFIRRAFEVWGNPSSAHALGRAANALLEDCRAAVAKQVRVEASEVVFTSGGSEASTTALWGSYLTQTPFRLVTSPVEHSSVRDTTETLRKHGAEVRHARLLPSGEIDLDHLRSLISDFRPHLVSLMVANNETGILFPTDAIAALCREKEALFHADAVQALGKIPSALYNAADFFSLSAHKIYGPKGVGALVVKKGRKLIPTHYGGSQEIKRRGGTQNMIGIAGFAGACNALPPEEEFGKVSVLRDLFEQKLKTKLDGIRVNGENARRIPNTSNIRFEGISLEILLSALDLDGVYASAGSACSSGSISPSPVLLAMGLPTEAARECLRFSWGADTTEADIDTAASCVIHHVTRIRSRRKA